MCFRYSGIGKRTRRSTTLIDGILLLTYSPLPLISCAPNYLISYHSCICTKTAKSSFPLLPAPLFLLPCLFPPAPCSLLPCLFPSTPHFPLPIAFAIQRQFVQNAQFLDRLSRFRWNILNLHYRSPFLWQTAVRSQFFAVKHHLGLLIV